MAGAMKFSLTCPRCDGKGRLRECLSHLPRRRPARHDGDRGGSHSRRGAAGLPAARGGQRQRRNDAARRRAISTSPSAWKRIRSSAAKATTSTSQFRSRYRKPAWAPRSKCPPSTAGPAQDSAGHAERAEIPAARERRAELAQEQARRPDRRSRRSRRPRCTTSAPGNCCANWRKCIPKIRAPKCGARCRAR